MHHGVLAAYHDPISTQSRVPACQVPLNSVAGEAGCRSNDYLVKINGVDVFNLSHDKAKQLIKSGGDRLELVIER